MESKGIKWFVIFMIALLIFLLALFVSGCSKTDGGSTPQAQPPSADEKPIILPPELEAGRAVFQQHCVMCHGQNGMGDGPAAEALNPKPRNFTNKAEWVTFGDDEATLRVIREGGPVGLGRPSAMPPWQGALSEDEIRSVMKYEKSLAK